MARATTSISPSSRSACPRVLAASAPDLVVYIAGADPHEGDRLGRLALTFDGLARRDAMVLDRVARSGSRSRSRSAADTAVASRTPSRHICAPCASRASTLEAERRIAQSSDAPDWVTFTSAVTAPHRAGVVSDDSHHRGTIGTNLRRVVSNEGSIRTALLSPHPPGTCCAPPPPFGVSRSCSRFQLALSSARAQQPTRTARHDHRSSATRHAVPVPTAVAVAARRHHRRSTGISTTRRGRRRRRSRASPRSTRRKGSPRTQRTEVRFLYDADALYVGARMYETNGPKDIVTRLVRRDGDIESDYFEVVIDATTTTSAAPSSTSIRPG